MNLHSAQRRLPQSFSPSARSDINGNVDRQSGQMVRMRCSPAANETGALSFVQNEHRRDLVPKTGRLVFLPKRIPDFGFTMVRDRKGDGIIAQSHDQSGMFRDWLARLKGDVNLRHKQRISNHWFQLSKTFRTCEMTKLSSS